MDHNRLGPGGLVDGIAWNRGRFRYHDGAHHPGNGNLALPVRIVEAVGGELAVFIRDIGPIRIGDLELHTLQRLMGAGAAPLDDDQIACGSISKFEANGFAAADQGVLGAVVQQVARLGPYLPRNHCGSRGEALHQNLARAVGHIPAVVGADEVSAAVRQQELDVRERLPFLIIRDLRNKQRPQRRVAEPQGDHILLFARDIDSLGFRVDEVAVRAFQFLTDIGALF